MGMLMMTLMTSSGRVDHNAADHSHQDHSFSAIGLALTDVWARTS
jgi:hypothetical protein